MPAQALNERKDGLKQACTSFVKNALQIYPGTEACLQKIQTTAKTVETDVPGVIGVSDSPCQ